MCVYKHALRIVSMDKILCFINALIIIVINPFTAMIFENDQ